MGVKRTLQYLARVHSNSCYHLLMNVLPFSLVTEVQTLLTLTVFTLSFIALYISQVSFYLGLVVRRQKRNRLGSFFLFLGPGLCTRAVLLL